MTHRCTDCQWGEAKDGRCANVASELYAQAIYKHVACDLFQSQSRCRLCSNAAYNRFDKAYFCFRQNGEQEEKNVTNLIKQPCFEKKNLNP